MQQLAALRIVQRAPIVVASLTGEVDLSNVHQVRDDVLRAVPNSASALVLDLTETLYLDSQGIGMLLDIVHRLHALSAQRRGSCAHAGGARQVVSLSADRPIPRGTCRIRQA